jgi:hypothetical protein
MNLEHDPLRPLSRETTTTRARRRNMRDFNTKREERNMRANADRVTMRNRAVENRRALQTISARVGRQDGFELAILGHPDLGERYTGLPIRRGGGREVKNFLLNGGSVPHLTRER